MNKNELHQEFLQFYKDPKNISRRFVIYKKMNVYREILCHGLSDYFKDLPIQQLLYHSVNNIKQLPKCSICSGENTRFVSYNEGYKDTCSTSCGRKKASKIANSYQEKQSLYFKCTEPEFKQFLISKFPRPGLKPPLIKALSEPDWNDYVGNKHIDGLHQRVYMYMNDIIEIPKCIICGKDLTFKNMREGFVKFCSSSCCSKNFHNSEDRQIREERYKRARTEFKRKWGLNSDGYKEIQKKRRETSIENWGESHYMKSEKGREHLQDLLTEKYGWSHPMKNPELVQRNREAGIYSRWEKNMKQKYFEKTGYKTPMANPEIQDKIKQTVKEKYGSEIYMNSKDFKKKVKATFMENYGVDNPWKDSKIQEKALKNSGKLKDYKLSNGEMVKVRGYDGIGYNWLLENEDFDNILYEFNCDSIEYEFKDKSRKYIPDFQIKGTNRLYEVKSWWTFLRSIDQNVLKMLASAEAGYDMTFMICSDEKVLCFLAIDDFIGKDQLEVESLLESYGINISEEFYFYSNYGLFFPYYGLHLILHDNLENERLNFGVMDLILKKDRVVKTCVLFKDLCIYENELMKHRILNLMHKNFKSVYARNCEVKEIKYKEASLFIDENHVQGFKMGKKQKFYGLYLDNLLVSVMQFGSPRFKKDDIKDDSWELLRFCSLKGYNVVGGAGKLMKTFERENDYSMIISYADASWSNGNVYNILGFRLDSYTGEGYWYLNENLEREHRIKYQKHKLVEMGYDKNKTEKEIVEEDIGLLRFFDCGNFKYIKYNEN